MLKFDDVNAPEDATNPPKVILVSCQILNLLWQVCTKLKVRLKELHHRGPAEPVTYWVPVAHIPNKLSCSLEYPCCWAQTSSGAAAISSIIGSARPFLVRSTLLI
jgi:hypothetical protein